MVMPTVAVIPKGPNLGGVSIDAGVDSMSFHRLVVDGPETTVVVELPGSLTHGHSKINVREGAEEVRDFAGVIDLLPGDIKAHQPVHPDLSGIHQTATIRSMTVMLVQPILEIDLLPSLVLAEVDDDIDPLGNAHHDAWRLERFGLEIAISRDDNEVFILLVGMVVLTPVQEGMRQESESVVVESPPVGYSSPL